MDKEFSTFGRDPFEGMEWPFEPGEPPPAAPAAVSTPAPVGRLRGKGVWLFDSGDVDMAIEMALAIGATHVFYRAGHRGMFFVDATRRVCARLQQAGLVPFAWFQARCDDPNAEAALVVKSLRAGCQGVILEVGPSAAGKTVGAAALGRRLGEAGVDPEQLYYASLPNIWQHLDLPYREMNAFCQGGFMPQCFPSHGRTPRTVIGKWAYGEHARWSAEWGSMPPLYPVLAAHKDERGTPLSAPEFVEWAETLAAYDPPFFSVYHTRATPSELWAILASMGRPPAAPPVEAVQPPPAVEVVPPPIEAVLPPPPVEARPAPLTAPVESKPAPPPTRAPAAATPAPRPPVAPPPAPAAAAEPAVVYHHVTVNDSVWNICERYGISRDQFWEWNGHLWDEHGLPRDGLYMQEGWRLRVG